MKVNEIQSQTIDFVRFPLIVGVVLIHSSIVSMNFGTLEVNTSSFPISYYLSVFFSDILASIAVPAFFFISGFLFFYNVDTFSWNVYKEKLWKRFVSLFVPYLLWNILIIVLYFVAQMQFPELISGNKKTFDEYCWYDWLLILWDTNLVDDTAFKSVPFNYPLWFLRDLMVIVCLSPLVYYIVKKLRMLLVLMLIGYWLSSWDFSITGLDKSCVTFFCLGAYFSIHKKDFLITFCTIGKFCAVAYLSVVVFELFMLQELDSWLFHMLHKMGILFGMITLFAVSSYCLSKGFCRVSGQLVKSSFFVYAYHAYPLIFLKRFVLHYCPPSADWMLCLYYLFCPIVVIAVGYLMYSMLNNKFPGFTRVLMGWR